MVMGERSCVKTSWELDKGRELKPTDKMLCDEEPESWGAMSHPGTDSKVE